MASGLSNYQTRRDNTRNNNTTTTTLPSVTGNNEMKEIVEKLENQRKDHEDGIKFMNLRKLREIVSIASYRAAHFSSNSIR